jgi:DNA-binding PadR family transcriptional regulator
MPTDLPSTLVRRYGIGATQALLEVLATDGEAYGLELRDRVRLRTKGTIVLGPGSLYPALHAFERDGLATAHQIPSPRGGRPKVYYALTELGRQVADALRNEACDLYRRAQ